MEARYTLQAQSRLIETKNANNLFFEKYQCSRLFCFSCSEAAKQVQEITDVKRNQCHPLRKS